MWKKMIGIMAAFTVVLGVWFSCETVQASETDTRPPVVYYIDDRIYSPEYAGDTLGIGMNIEESSGISDAWMIYKNGTREMYLKLAYIEEDGDERYRFDFYTDYYAPGGKYRPYKLVLVDDSPNKNKSEFLYDSEDDEFEWNGEETNQIDISFSVEQEKDWIVTNTGSETFESDWKSLEEDGTIVVEGTSLPANFLAYAKEKNATIIVMDKGGVAELEFKAKDITDKALTEGMELTIERSAFFDESLGNTSQGIHQFLYVTGKNAEIPMYARARIHHEIYWESFKFQVNACKVKTDEQGNVLDVSIIKEDMNFFNINDDDAANIEFKLSKGVEEGFSTYAVTIQSHKHIYTIDSIPRYASFEVDGTTILRCKKCDVVQVLSIKKVDTVELSYTTTTYNGKTKKPSVVVKDVEGNELKEGTDYKLTYQSGRKLPGKYYVNVILKGKYKGSKKVYFRILPKKPSSFDAELYGYNDIKLSWKSSSGAEGYHVYQYNPEAEEQYVLLGSTTKTYYKIANCEDNATYQYAVEAYDLDKSEDERYVSERTDVKSITTLKLVDNLAVEKTSSSEVTIHWEEVPAATGYQVSASTSKTKTNRISTTSKLSKVYKPSKNKILYYKVRAYKTEDGEKIYTPWTDVTAYELKYVYALKDLKAKLIGPDDINLSWDKSSGANKYYIYYKTPDMEEPEIVGTTVNTKMDMYDLPAGVKHEFKVVPAYCEAEVDILSGTADDVTIYTLKTLDAPVVEKSGTKVKVRWENISGETGYQISKSTTLDGIKIVSTYATTKGTSKTISATKGKEYYYRVRVYKTVNGKKVYSDWSEATVFTR